MSPGKKALLAGLLLLAVGLGAAGLFRQSLRVRVVEWRIEENLESFHEAADVGDWGTAHRSALAAHQLNPLRLGPLSALLRVGIEGRTGNLVAVAVRILQHPEARVTEKATALDAFLEAGDEVVFRHLFERLSDVEKMQPQVMRIYAKYLGRSGRIGEAAEICESLLQTDADPNLALDLAVILAPAAGGNAGVAERVQRLIIGLIGGPDRVIALRALRLLQAIPPDEWQVDAILKAAAWIEGHSDATATDHLLVAAIQIRGDESRRGQVVDSAVSRFGRHHPSLVARWLAALGDYERALQVIDVEAARQTPEAYLARVRILLRAGRDEQASEWLATPHRGIRASVVSSLRAVAASSELDANRHWEKALQQAELEESADAFWRISGSAAAAGNRSVEMRAATEALQRPGPHPAVAELGPIFEWLYRNDRTEDLRQVFRSLIRREPDSPTLRNNLAYLDIISGRFGDQTIVELESLRAEFSAVTEISTSLAVACLARGDYRRAREILAGAVSDWDAAPASTVAAYAVALKSANERERKESALGFESLRDRIDWDEMLGIEREFFQSQLDRVEVSVSVAAPDALDPAR